MYNVYEKSYPHNNFLYRAETEQEAKEAVSYFSTIYKIVFYKEVTREQINHEANIFTNSQ